MPGTSKRWYFELLLDGIRGIAVVRAGKQVTNTKGELLGAVVGLSTPTTRKGCTQAKDFLNQAVQVNFKGGISLVLNRELFEWNKTPFSRHFKLLPDATAVDFVETWNMQTEFNTDRGFIVPKGDEHSSQVQYDSQEEVLSDGQQDSSTSLLTTPASSQDELSPSLKKLKHCDPLDDSIYSKRIGTCELLLNSLIEPDKKRCIRPVDPVFLQVLIKKFERDPSAPGVPPVAVLCTSVKNRDEFDSKRKDAYRYEVLGGQHTAMARKEVFKKHPENMLLQHILTEVYVGLSDDEALRLASRHNINGHFVHKMTHRDYVEACRLKLFVLEGKDPSRSETPNPSPEWKDTCKRCILPHEMGRCTMDNIFNQACFSKSVWNLTTTVMDMFENGELKDQTLNEKSLVAKPDFKQQYLSPIQCLPESFKLETLQEVVDGELSLNELKGKAASYRYQKTIERAFCRITNTTWEEAKRRFPEHTTTSRLTSFKGVFSGKQIPPSFQAYCEGALRSESLDHLKSSLDLYKYNGCGAYIVERDVLDTCCQDIRNVYSTYMGANLLIANIPKEWSEHEIKNVVYSCKQLNTIPEKTLPLYNIALVGSLSSLELMKRALQSCVDEVSVCYWHDNLPTVKSPSVGFIPAVGAAVIGHYSLNGKLEKNHFNMKTPRTNLFNSNPEEGGANGTVPISVFEQLIEALSFEGNCIVDATIGNGNCAVAALKVKRDVVTIKADVIPTRAALAKLCSS